MLILQFGINCTWLNGVTLIIVTIKMMNTFVMLILQICEDNHFRSYKEMQIMFNSTGVQQEVWWYKWGYEETRVDKILYSWMLSRGYQVVRNWYSLLLFTSEDRFCANLSAQEQLTNMTSQYQYLAFAWHHRSTVAMSQCYVSNDRPWQEWRNEGSIIVFSERSMIVFSGIVCSGHEIACKK